MKVNKRLAVVTLVFLTVGSVAGFAGVVYWKNNKPLVPHVELTPFELKMMKGGYSRDHETHRWYPRYEAYAVNGCAIYGPPWDATFNCRTPLRTQEGIADSE